MRLAIEEGFILDVLKHYATYKTYFRLERGGQDGQLVPLSTIIKTLNDRFGTAFTAADQPVFDQIEEALVANPDLAQQAKVNTMGNYRFGFDTAFLDDILDRRSQNDGIFTRILDDPDFAEAVKAVQSHEQLSCCSAAHYPLRGALRAAPAPGPTAFPSRRDRILPAGSGQ